LAALRHQIATKPLIRLILNQLGGLTEELNAKDRRHRLLLMLDEFPALAVVFESALAFMAGSASELFDRAIAQPDRESRRPNIPC